MVWVTAAVVFCMVGMVGIAADSASWLVFVHSNTFTVIIL